MKIYTGQGDNGFTTLKNGIKVRKNHIRIEACGAIDELNAFIGFLLSDESFPDSEKNNFDNIQNCLFKIGSIIADSKPENKLSDICITKIEKAIDNLSQNLPNMTTFIKPGVNRISSICHICRTICRRAERNILGIVDNNTLCYINRLSDYFFELSRTLS